MSPPLSGNLELTVFVFMHLFFRDVLCNNCIFVLATGRNIDMANLSTNENTDEVTSPSRESLWNIKTSDKEMLSG